MPRTFSGSPLVASCALLSLLLPASDSPGSPYTLQQEWIGEAPLDQFGFAVAPVGDIDGDLFPDLLVGANGNDAGASGGGAVYLYRGGASWPTVPDLRYAGSLPTGLLGSSAAGGLDLNGDGIADWVVGAPGTGPDGLAPGRAYVFYGGAPLHTAPDLILQGDAPGGQFGESVCLLRDWDGSGRNVLAVGAPRAGAGRVAIYRGGAGGLVTTPVCVLHAGPLDERFGHALARLPDDNGDGHDELLVGVPHSSRTATWAGAVIVYRGAAAVDTTADVALAGAAAGDELGTSIAATPDLDGDGGPEILAGAPVANTPLAIDTGKVFLYHAGAALDPAPDATFTGVAAYDHFGYAVAAGFDWNGDGRPDLAVGAPEEDTGGVDAGACRVWFGGASWSASADVVLPGPAAGQHMGTALCSGGDLRHNGRGSLLVGGYDGTPGRVRLYSTADPPTAVVEATPAAAPGALVPPRPNPFNPVVRSALVLRSPGTWRVGVYDARGRLLAWLWQGWLPAGEQALTWDSRDAAGRALSSGVYYLRAQSAGVTSTVRVTLVR